MSFIRYNDYISDFNIMMSFEALRNKKFRKTMCVINSNTEILKQRIKDIKISTKFSENENIVLGIQNDENFIKFISSIKSKTNVVVVIFTKNNNIKCFIKSKESHPIVLLNFPIDNNKYYSKVNDGYYTFPIEQFNISNQHNNIINSGYSMYYLNDGKNLIFRYVDKTSRVDVPINKEINEIYLNKCLIPPSIDVILPRPTEHDNMYITTLYNASVNILASVKNNYDIISDLNMKNENRIVVKVNDKNMILKINSETGTTTTKTILEKENAEWWKIFNNKKYILPNRATLLKSTAINKIRSGSYTYLLFANYDENYNIIVRMIINEKINISQESNITLQRFIRDKYALFQIYYCKREEIKNTNYLNLLSIEDKH